MPFNGNGVFVRVRNWVNDAASNIPILATRHDSEDDNFAAGLTQCITRDGQTTVTANLPMAGFKHTAVGDATAANQYATLGQAQKNTSNWAIAGGTANARTATFSPSVTALTNGQEFNLRITTPNTTTTPTFSPDGLTARTIVKNNNAPLAIGELIGDIILRYDLPNTRYELVNSKGITALTGDVTASGSGSVAATIANGAVTAAKLEQDALILGRRDITGNATLLRSDVNKRIVSGATAANTLTIPTNADVAIPVQSSIEVLVLNQANPAYTLTIAAAGGVTIYSSTPLVSSAPFSVFQLTKVATDAWFVSQYGRSGSTVGEALFTAANQAAAQTALGIGALGLLDTPPVFTGNANTNLTFPIGDYVLLQDGSTSNRNSTIIPTLNAATTTYTIAGGGTALAGVWKARGRPASDGCLAQRIS